MFNLIPFNKKSDIWFATISATTIDASVVEAAICGVAITFGLLNKTFSFAGSFEKTSTAAPAIKPSFKASFKSFSSTILVLFANLINIRNEIKIKKEVWIKNF